MQIFQWTTIYVIKAKGAARFIISRWKLSFREAFKNISESDWKVM